MSINFSRQEILVVMAGKPESQGKIESLGFKVLYVGVGKVNATLRLMRRINQTLPKCIINLGIAGSSRFPVFTLVNCTEFFQADMDVTGLGTPLYKTPFEEAISLKNGIRIDSLPQSALFTADRFITDPDCEHPVVDMEGYALAKVCDESGIPFLCVKAISDSASTEKVPWKEVLCRISDLFKDFLTESVY